MNINEYLQSYDLLDSQNQLTDRAKKLGYQSDSSILQLKQDIEQNCIIDCRSKEIIPAYKYYNNPIAVTGDSISSIIKFILYKNNEYIYGIEDLTDEDSYKFQVNWRNSVSNITGIYETTIESIEGDFITYLWIIDPMALNRAGELEFSFKFVSFDTNNNINYSFGSQVLSLDVKPSLNFEFTTDEDADYDIKTFNNPYLSTNNTYIIDCGEI